MAIQYSYKVNGVRVNSAAGLTDVVKQVEIMVTGKDGEAQFQLPVLVELGDPNPASFTPFASMTEEQLIDWANNAPVPDGMPGRLDGVRAHIAHVVAKEAERLSLQEKPLPWAPPPAPVAPVAPPPTDG